MRRRGIAYESATLQDTAARLDMPSAGFDSTPRSPSPVPVRELEVGQLRHELDALYALVVEYVAKGSAAWSAVSGIMKKVSKG